MFSCSFSFRLAGAWSADYAVGAKSQSLTNRRLRFPRKVIEQRCLVECPVKMEMLCVCAVHEGSHVSLATGHLEHAW